MGEPLPSYTPVLTNAKKADYKASGHYEVNGNVVTFTAMVAARGLCESKDNAGFGLTLPVPAKTGVRTIFALSLDGRDADHGVWSGHGQIYASASDGKQIDRLRVTGTTNGAAVQNITFMYGNSEGATKAEIITVSGSYIAATAA